MSDEQEEELSERARKVRDDMTRVFLRHVDSCVRCKEWFEDAMFAHERVQRQQEMRCSERIEVDFSQAPLAQRYGAR